MNDTKVLELKSSLDFLDVFKKMEITSCLVEKTSMESFLQGTTLKLNFVIVAKSPNGRPQFNAISTEKDFAEKISFSISELSEAIIPIAFKKYKKEVEERKAECIKMLEETTKELKNGKN